MKFVLEMDVDNRKNLSYVRHTLRVSVSVNLYTRKLHPDLVKSKGLEKRAPQEDFGSRE